MLKKHNKHGPLKWFAGVLAAAGLLLALPVAQPVYAAGDTGTSGTAIQTSYIGFSAVSDVKVNNVSVKQYGKYTLTFNANGGKGDMTSESGQKLLDDRITLTNKYTKTGYTFTGWDTKADGSGTDYKDKQVVTADDLGVSDEGSVTLYAQWKANTYSIHFDANRSDVTGTMADQKMVYDETDLLNNNSYTSPAAVLTGWKDDSGKTYANMQTVRNMTSANGATVTLHGVWENVQVVDGTRASIDDASHTHIWVWKHTDGKNGKHWQECQICGAKRNESAHTFVSKWSSAKGAADCSSGNHCTHTCSICSYSYTDDIGGDGTKKAAHSPRLNADGSVYAYPTRIDHAKQCVNCGELYDREQHYHMVNGKKVYTSKTDFNDFSCDYCQPVSGPWSPLWYGSWTADEWDPSKTVYEDWMVNEGLVIHYNADLSKYSTDSKYQQNIGHGGSDKTVYTKISNINISGHTITYDITATAPAGWTLQSTSLEGSGYDSARPYADALNATVISNNGNVVTQRVTCTVKSGVGFRWIRPNTWFNWQIPDGKTANTWVALATPSALTAPTVTNASVNTSVESGTWATQSAIKAEGTADVNETSVSIDVYDDDGNKYISSLEEPVSNGKWTMPETYIDLDASTSGKILHVKATGKSKFASKVYDVKVAQVDSKPPTAKITIESEPSDAGEWAARKKVTITATDDGSGIEAIGINSHNDEEHYTDHQNTKTREYVFRGDKYNDQTWSVFVKDYAGNEAELQLNIGKIDNTPPTVSKVDINGNSVTVSASDINDSLGATGSGIDHYAYVDVLSGDLALHNAGADPTFTLDKGEYRIVAVDKVGNISNPTRIVIRDKLPAKAKKASGSTFFDPQW